MLSDQDVTSGGSELPVGQLSDLQRDSNDVSVAEGDEAVESPADLELTLVEDEPGVESTTSLDRAPLPEHVIAVEQSSEPADTEQSSRNQQPVGTNVGEEVPVVELTSDELQSCIPAEQPVSEENLPGTTVEHGGPAGQEPVVLDGQSNVPAAEASDKQEAATEPSSSEPLSETAAELVTDVQHAASRDQPLEAPAEQVAPVEHSESEVQPSEESASPGPVAEQTSPTGP